LIEERKQKTKDNRQQTKYIILFLDNNIFSHYNFHFGAELCYTIITQLAYYCRTGVLHYHHTVGTLLSHRWHTIDALLSHRWHTIVALLAYYCCTIGILLALAKREMSGKMRNESQNEKWVTKRFP